MSPLILAGSDQRSFNNARAGGAENEANAEATSSAAGNARSAETGKWIKWRGGKKPNYQVASFSTDNHC